MNPPDRRTVLKQAAAATGLAGFCISSANAAEGSASNSPNAMTPDEMREQLQRCLGGPWPEPGPP